MRPAGMIFKDEAEGVYYRDIYMDDETLLAYCLFPDARTHPDDMHRCYMENYLVAGPGPMLLFEKGAALKRKHLDALPICPCMKGTLHRHWYRDKTKAMGGSYQYICPVCGERFEEQHYEGHAKFRTAAHNRGDLMARGICIRLGTADEWREKEDKGKAVSSETNATVAALANLATGGGGSTPIDKPAPLASGASQDAPISEKFSMAFCPKCLKKGNMLRDTGSGPEWFCTLCNAVFYANKNEETGIMMIGEEKTAPMPGM